MELLVILVIIALFLLIVFLSSLMVVQQYERGIRFRFGKVVGSVEPGLHFRAPIADRIIKIDVRTRTIDVSPQEVITKDNVTITVDAVVYFNIFDARLAIIAVQNYFQATTLLSQTVLRDIVGQYELDEVLQKREQINQALEEIIDRETDPWGIKVTVVEIKQIGLPDNMKRVMAAQAEAERDKRAKVISAEGELASAKNLVDASTTLSGNPLAIQLRYLQTLGEISAEKSTIIVFPVPMNMLAGLANMVGNNEAEKK
jgi:regulator of protease activity HflC (stomatin/prohibitin superfamily)